MSERKLKGMAAWSVIVVVLLFFAMLGYVAEAKEVGRFETRRSKLLELDDGIYAVLYNSNVGGQKIVLNCNDKIREFSGNVHIEYTKEEPYAMWTKYLDSVDGADDSICVYVPHGSMDFREEVIV